MKRLFTQFSFPGGIPSHVAPETPGSINEGGELGYSLAHAYGAVFDNPDLIAACVIGDGDHICLSRLSVVNSSSNIPASQSQKRACLRLQGRRDDNHAL